VYRRHLAEHAPVSSSGYTDIGCSGRVLRGPAYSESARTLEVGWTLSNNSRWSRVLFEGVMIVTSILLAFLIQAWWENRQDRVAESAYLVAIRDEIDRNLAALDGNVRVSELRDRDLSLAADLMARGVPADSSDIFLRSLVGGARSGGPPRIATAVFDELASTGRIILIQDVEVRRAVLELYAVIDVTFERMARNSAQVESRLFAEVARHLPAGSYSRGADPSQFDLDLSKVSPDEIRGVVQSLVTDEGLRAELRAEALVRADEASYRDRYREALEEAQILFGRTSN